MKELEILKLPSFNFGNYNCCAYCGVPAEHRDHVVAVSYQSNSKRRNVDGLGPWCWACASCNLSLSNRYFDSFKARCEWMSWKLSLKAKPIEWHEWELKPLDYGLRSHIKHEIAKAKSYRCRADFYGSRDFYLNLESLIWEIGQIKGTTIGAKFICTYFSSMLEDVSQIYRP